MTIYEVSISYSLKVKAKIKVLFATESQKESKTGQNLDAPEFHSGIIIRLHLIHSFIFFFSKEQDVAKYLF